MATRASHVPPHDNHRRTPRHLTAMRQRRLRAADLSAHGATQAEVARTLGASRQAALVWYRRWQAGGAHALHGAGRAGRRPRLSAAQLDQALLAGARTHGDDTGLWTRWPAWRR